MGRMKLPIKKIQNTSSRLVTYSKRRNGLFKKITELSILCDADIGVILFSPAGRLSTYTNNGRMEDILIRYLNLPDKTKGGTIKDQENLIESLKRLKVNSEVYEKIAEQEALQQELAMVKERLVMAQEKLRFYKPDPEKIVSVRQAEVHERGLKIALHRIKKLKEELIKKQTPPPKAVSIEISTSDVEDGDQVSEDPIVFNQVLVSDKSMDEETRIPMGPHLSLSYIKTHLKASKPSSTAASPVTQDTVGPEVSNAVPTQQQETVTSGASDIEDGGPVAELNTE